MIGLPPKMAGFDVIRLRRSVSLLVLSTTHLPIMLPQFRPPDLHGGDRRHQVEVAAAPVLALGAAGGVPGSLGVVEGDGRIPYTPEARAIKDENAANWIDRDPELKCYLPGIPRAMYMPYPFQIVQSFPPGDAGPTHG